MKIIIIGKRDQMGTTPAIRVKGMSQVRYQFLWDKEIRHYAYEPKNQKEVDDIFRTQGKLYKSMFFSVWLPEPELEKEVQVSAGSKARPTAKSKKKQPVEKEVVSA
jgi:hypothetical protein